MILCHNIDDLPAFPGPIVLTIGMFDGVHSGHRYLFSEMKKKGASFVLTFSNHPAEILRGKAPSLLTTLQEKLRLIEEVGIDGIILLPFTQELANQPYDLFLQSIHARLPFTFLMLGEGAAFGQGNRGTALTVAELGKQLGFEPIYLPKLTVDGLPVSSERIRRLLASSRLHS